ncbi:MAG TPA: MlaD family protein [Candidatus Angelobacter sp.]|nr:MlaD family protein [Candidatus Angelobacter sp.]
MPSQKQLRWSELKVGITVTAALVTLFILVFLMRGTTGFFTKRIRLVTYFDNAEGLRAGQPVDLQGVAIGNVESVVVIPNHGEKAIQVVMRINGKYQPLLRKDDMAAILTAGVLGESFIDIDGRFAKGKPIADGDELPSANAPGIQDVVRSSQSTLQNMDILVKRVDRLVAEVETGRGTIHDLLYDATLIDKANGILNEIQSMLNDVNKGKGTLGALFNDPTLYNKANDAIDKIDKMVEETNNGKGNLGKLFKDEALYNNLNQTAAKANKLMDDVNAGRGSLGKLTKDEELAKKLENTINKLSIIADRLEAGEGSAGLFLRDPRFYNNSDQLLVESRNLVKAVRENPKKYLTIQLKIF